MSARTRAYLYMIATIAIWGMAGPVIKHALVHFDTLTFLTYRFLLTSLVLVPLLLLKSPNSLHRLREFTTRQWFIFLLSSFIGSTVQLGLLFWGYSLTTSFEGALISSISPIFVTLAGYYFLRERVTLRERWGLVVAFFGSLIIVLEPLLNSGFSLTASGLAGNTLILLATIGVAIHALLIKTNLRAQLSPSLMTTAMFFIGLVTITPLTVLTHTPAGIRAQFVSAPVITHLEVVYMALLSGALAYWWYHKAQKTIEISEAHLFHYLTPVFAAPLSFLWLKEPASIFMFIGIAVTSIGVAIAEIKSLSNIRHLFPKQ